MGTVINLREATTKKKRDIHGKLALVIEKHGERSNVVKAIEAAILALLTATVLLTFASAQAIADPWWHIVTWAHAYEVKSSGEKPLR